ncbi:unnamed protein product [Rhizoctonia solani]|uniref:C2H2-type domain-containing protein n=1 Tax=Rhizoctonia solani TaxID=456999 RepID=A0A8H3ALQ3_9AGAM|nr:unnamed protein product [Rhizoctonia solani]
MTYDHVIRDGRVYNWTVVTAEFEIQFEAGVNALKNNHHKAPVCILKKFGMSGLPPPTTAIAQHRKAHGLYNLAKSKRGVALLLILSLASSFYIFDAGPLFRSQMSSYGHSQSSPRPQLEGLDVSGTDGQSTTPLSSLGLEADRSFHLGSTVKKTYRAELEQFIEHSFPKGLRERAHASLELYLGDAARELKLPEIPHNIYQTSKKDIGPDWRSSTWRNIPDYKYWFFNDESADKWVREVFGGTEMEKVWDALGPGVKRSDMLRYLLVAVEGGIYSDMDTVRLKELDKWGHGAKIQGPKSKGLPSVFVGIEADVGTRSDWHKWWPRPLQIAQWTFAASPLHPILIDTLRRVHYVTAAVEANKAKNQTSDITDLKEHWVGGELLRDDGTISIMEWTGPGVFTDSVIRYIATEHNVAWPALKNLHKPVRIKDVIILPVTGFSPGVGLFGAGETSNAEAMVKHLFSGSWKSAAMSKPYDPPEYTYTAHSPATQPVNFNDEPSGSNAYHASKHSLGASTEQSYPQSKFDSGVSAEQGDPFVNGDGYKGGLNERGETRAQALASEYRSSPVNLSPRDGALSSASSQSFSSSEQSKDLLAKRKSVASSNLDAMTYVDENYNIYRSPRMKNGDQFNDNASLVDHAAAPAGASHRMTDLEYAEPVTPSPDHPDNAKKSVMARLLGNDGARHPIEQRIQAKRAGAGRQKYPFVVWLLTLAMLGVMIWELVRNNQEQGSPISLKPYVNPMLGPSSSGLINLGGRFVPCMKLVSEIPPSFNLGCFNNTANPPTELCSIETLCGFGEFKGGDPNQWFRFITPIFLHAGIIHFALNMFAQLTLSAQVEREMGSGAFLILYASAGIFGNVLGGNFALVGVPSVGASGAIFGTVAVMWVDLLAHWKLEYRPGRKLAMLCVDLIIGVALGFVPGVDNFAHLGGFLMGLLTAIVLYPLANGVVTCRAFRLAGIIDAKVNTHGTPRLAKFYTPTPANTRAALPRRIFELVSSRPAGLCNFLDAPGLLTDTGTSRTGDLSSVGGGGWEWEGEEKELQRARVVYRLYATLYFVFVVDGAESELGVLDLIQVFVESLDRAFENVCELDLVFHFDEVHHILAELIQGGLVLETNVEEIARAVQERQKVQKAAYAADNPLAAIGSGAVGGSRGGGLRGLQTPLGWIANRAFPTVGTRFKLSTMTSLSNFAIPPDPAQKTNELDWLLYSGANANAGIDALLAPHPDAFERELDDLGIDDSLLSSLVVPNDDIGNLNAFLAHRSPVCGPGSAITASSDSLSYYNEFSNHGLESLYNESLSAYGGAVSEHSLFTHSELDINLDALNTFHMPSPQRQSRSPSGEISDNSSAYGHSHSSNSLFDVPTGYENISANGYYIQPSPSYARRNHSGLVHRDVPSQHLQARAQAHPYVPADHAYDHAGSGNESPEQSDPRRKYQCPQCPRAFARQFNLKTHMATHDPNRTKPHVCHHAGCGRSFSRKHDLGRHLVSIHQDAEHGNISASTSPKRAGSSVGVKSEREWCDRCGRGWVKSERARDACQCSEDS